MATLNIWEAELSRRTLYDFTSYTKPNFRKNWFHETYYRKLDEFRKGEIKRLMVFVPPQHGKSEGSTRRLPAHMIGHNPDLKIGIASYSSTKARKFGREIKRIIQSPEYKEMFPAVKLADGGTEGYQNAANEFETVGREGSIKLDGYNGAWTGDPIDVFILDDLYKSREEALSEAVNGSVISFWNSVAEARLHNDSQVLIVFTRWADNDLAGYLLEHEPEMWEVVRYPALKVGPPTGEDPREAGEALLPFKHNEEKLLRTKKRDPIIFDSLYQQDPQPLAGLLFPKSALQYYNPDKVDVEKLAEYRFFSVDPADDGGDDLSAPFAYLVGDKIYLPHIIYNTDGTDINEIALVEQIVGRKMNGGVIEGQSAWKLFAKAVVAKVEAVNEDCDIRIISQSKNKHTRILAQASFIVNHFVFRSDYEEHPQYAKFMKCLTSYMKVQAPGQKAKHDDAPDSAAEIAKHFQIDFAHIFG